MPTVPTYGSPRIASTVQPDFRQSNNGASPEDFGAGIGRGLQQAGGVLGEIAHAEQQKADDARLMAFETQQGNDETELLFDPEKGAYARRGLDAMDYDKTVLPEWDKRQNAAINALPAHLKDRGERLAFERRQQAQRGLQRHALEEGDRYADQQAVGLVASATDAVGLNYQDPGRIGAELATIDHATRTRLRGAPKEAQDAAVHAAQSNALRVVLERHLVNGGPDEAQAAYAKYGPGLDANDTLAFETRLQNERDSLDSKTATALARRETQAEQAVKFVQDAASTGIPMTPDALFEQAGKVKGTSQEQEFSAAVGTMQEVSRVRKAPFAEQQQYADELERQLQQGSADPKRDLARLNTLRSALAASRKQAKESPISFYQNQGGEAVEPIDFSMLNSEGGRAVVESRLAGRFASLAAMRRKYGPEVGMNPWRPEEESALNQALSRPDTTVDSKLGILALLGKAAPNADAFRDSIAPIALSDRVSYIAAQEQYAHHNSGNSGPIAPIILRGSLVLRDKSIPLPTEEKFKAAFDADMGDVYPAGSEQRSDAYIKFKTIYAGMIEKVPGSQREEANGELDTTLRESAVNLATGGLYEYQSRKVPKPWGMSDDDFAKRVQTQIVAAAGAAGFPTETLSDLPMMAVPGHEGMYFLLNQGRAQLGPRTGKPILVKP